MNEQLNDHASRLRVGLKDLIEVNELGSKLSSLTAHIKCQADADWFVSVSLRKGATAFGDSRA
jgi:hypothetical protein